MKEEINPELKFELSDADNENKHDIVMNIFKKKQFAEEIKNGLGKQIKENLNNVKIIKVPLHRKIIAFFKNILLKF